MENERLYDASGIADVIGTLGNTAAGIIGAFRGPSQSEQERVAQLAAQPVGSNMGGLLLIVGVVIAAIVALVLIFKK